MRRVTIAKVTKLFRTTPELKGLPVVVRGISGMSIAFAIANRLNLEVGVVRKPGETTNSYNAVEGYLPTGKFLIMDDFVGMGRTVNTILEVIKKESPNAVCVGLVLHSCGSKNQFESQWPTIPIYRITRK